MYRPQERHQACVEHGGGGCWCRDGKSEHGGRGSTTLVVFPDGPSMCGRRSAPVWGKRRVKGGVMLLFLMGPSGGSERERRWLVVGVVGWEGWEGAGKERGG